MTFVIKYIGTVGKSPRNDGEYYSSTGFNGMWHYHRWQGERTAMSFETREKAQGYKSAFTHSPIRGRVVKLVTPKGKE